MKNYFIFLFIFFSISYAQENKINLKRDFRGINLLEKYDDVYQKLKKDNIIILASSDFDLMDEEDRKTIVAKVPPYIDRIYYQFENDSLFVISIFFNNKKYSYYELYKALKEKYGKPISYDNLQSIWEDEKTKIVLDNLPSIKYIDKDTINKIISRDKTVESDTIRREIINEF